MWAWILSCFPINDVHTLPGGHVLANMGGYLRRCLRTVRSRIVFGTSVFDVYNYVSSGFIHCYGICGLSALCSRQIFLHTQQPQ